MIVGCYTLELYCDNMRSGNDGVHPYDAAAHPPVFTGETRAECVAKARAAGWVINRNSECYCPTCAKRRSHRKLEQYR